MKRSFKPEDLNNDAGGKGLEIKVPGFLGNPECPEGGQIFIEIYEGKLRVHVWNGESDPVTTECAPGGVCEDCWQQFPADQMRAFKYEPGIQLCEDCHDERMFHEDDEE
jgi:hypothetical protein